MTDFKQQRKAKLIEMLAETPNDVFINFAIAMEEMATENLQLAIIFFQKCIEINPNHIPSRFQLAKIAQSKGDVAQAIALLNEGIELLQKSNDTKTLNEFKSLLDEIEFF
jgi:tetratricopeptide (TPR) repeat protein